MSSREDAKGAMTRSEPSSRASRPRGRSGLYAILAFVGFASFAFAHPIHSSTADADYNASTQKLEVTLKTFADDFETALSAHEHRKISLEKTPAAELVTLMREYVTDTFIVKTRADEPAKLQWIGRELKESNELWLFFEFPLPGGVEGAKLRHGVLADHFGDQLNTVQVSDGARKTTLVFLPSHHEKTVRFPP